MAEKKKIGFIDLFIDEWHANNYPKWFREAKRGNEFELGYAWEEAPMEGRRNLQQWCAEMGMIPAASIEEVVEKSDCICVLAPANPEVHERLAEIALKSGKPVYIDKPFADSLATAERIFATAEKYGTPLMSSSALRFSDELLSGKLQAMKPILFTTTGGGRSFDEYGIHQLEMIVSVMGTDVKNITFTGNEKRLSLSYEFANGNMAQIAYSLFMPFTITAASEKESICFSSASHIFENLIDAMLDFFADGKSRVPKEETLAIASLLEKSVALLHGK
ncbi:MAG: Gfo/Idh/MocA family oxidoreductase [Lentisphaeria bacterium]|nr:Gfo/Idh/MocA family oxidoreductase [Lentisphaeria bacterium]